MSDFKQSADVKFLISFVDADGAPLPITGATIKFIMKARKSDPNSAALVSKQTGSGITITNGPGGLAEVSLTAADTDAITDKAVYCEGVAINGSSVVRTKTYHFVLDENIYKGTS